MQLSGISPQKIGNLLVQKRITSKREAWIITNPTEADLYERLDLSDKKNPEILIGDSLRVKDNSANIFIKSLDIAVLVFEK
jgi:hypothetical protein